MLPVISHMLVLLALVEFFARGNDIERLWERLANIRWPDDYYDLDV